MISHFWFKTHPSYARQGQIEVNIHRALIVILGLLAGGVSVLSVTH